MVDAVVDADVDGAGVGPGATGGAMAAVVAPVVGPPSGRAVAPTRRAIGARPDERVDGGADVSGPPRLRVVIRQVKVATAAVTARNASAPNTRMDRDGRGVRTPVRVRGSPSVSASVGSEARHASGTATSSAEADTGTAAGA